MLWRPFHEMNGDWFWWSHQARFKELWIYTWQYLTYKKKCNNLLWVFSVNYWAPGAAGKELPECYYPGHEYVDIVGCDIYVNYGHQYAKRCHDALWRLGNHKPMAITECGTMPNIPRLRDEQPFWIYWCTWWGFEGPDRGNSNDLYQRTYSHTEVLTQEEVVVKAPDTNRRVIRTFSDGKGSVKRAPSVVTVQKGTAVSLTATADSGWKFVGWSDTSQPAVSPLTITVNDHIVLSAIFKQLAGDRVNLLLNGDFSRGDTGWNSLGVFENAKAGEYVKDGLYTIAIISGGSDIWHVQLIQSNIRIERGKTYTLSFSAESSDEKTVFVKIGQDGGAYTAYLGANISTIDSLQPYRLSFTMIHPTDPAARLEFNVGKSAPSFRVKDVVLVEGVPDTEPKNE